MPPNKKQVELEPCPFCQVYLVVRRLGGFQHPATGCILQGLRVDPWEADKWNTRPSPPVEQMGDEERVARALCRYDGNDPDSAPDDDEPLWRAYKEEARAALEALSTPRPMGEEAREQFHESIKSAMRRAGAPEMAIMAFASFIADAVVETAKSLSSTPAYGLDTGDDCR